MGSYWIITTKQSDHNLRSLCLLSLYSFLVIPGVTAKKLNKKHNIDCKKVVSNHKIPYFIMIRVKILITYNIREKTVSIIIPKAKQCIAVLKRFLNNSSFDMPMINKALKFTIKIMDQNITI